MTFSPLNTVSFSPLWLRLRLDLPRIRGNWEYVFLLPHLAHPCPPLCHARTNLGRRPENMSPHAHRLQCVDSTDHPLMCLFMIPLTESGCLCITLTLLVQWACLRSYTEGGRKKKALFFMSRLFLGFLKRHLILLQDFFVKQTQKSLKLPLYIIYDVLVNETLFSD